MENPVLTVLDLTHVSSTPDISGFELKFRDVAMATQIPRLLQSNRRHVLLKTAETEFKAENVQIY